MSEDLSKYYRSPTATGVKSEHVRHLRKYLLDLVEKNGEITPDDIINSGKPFLNSYFGITAREAQKKEAENIAKKIIKCLYIDGHPAFTYNSETKSYKPFEEVVTDPEAYRVKLLLRYLRSALAYADGDLLDDLEAMIETLKCKR